MPPSQNAYNRSRRSNGRVETNERDDCQNVLPREMPCADFVAPLNRVAPWSAWEFLFRPTSWVILSSRKEISFAQKFTNRCVGVRSSIHILVFSSHVTFTPNLGMPPKPGIIKSSNPDKNGGGGGAQQMFVPNPADLKKIVSRPANHEDHRKFHPGGKEAYDKAHDAKGSPADHQAHVDAAGGQEAYDIIHKK